MNMILGDITDKDVSEAKEAALAKLAAFKAAYYNEAVDKAGLKDAANEVIRAMSAWIARLYDINEQSSEAIILLREMVAENYDPSRKGN